MVTIFKAMMAFVLLGFGFNASAQFCVPQQGSYINPVSGMREDAPRFFDRDAGCYITHRPQNAGSANQVVVPGVVLNAPPAYWGAGQNYVQQQGVYAPQYGWGNWGVQAQPSFCPGGYLVDKSFLERLASGGEQMVLSAISGYFGGRAIDYYRGQRDHRWERIAVNGAAGYGFFQGSVPGKVLVCPPQQVVAPPQMAQAPRALCTLPNGNRVPLSQQDCQLAEGNLEVPQRTQTCPQGLRLGVLRDDFPGDGKGHNGGDTVCAKPGDTNISRWL